MSKITNNNCTFVLNCNTFCGGDDNCILDINQPERKYIICKYLVQRINSVI